MRRAPLLLFALSATALAACDSQPEVSATNASVEDVARRVADSGAAAQMQPGRWEGEVRVKAMQVPGLTADQQREVSARTGGAHPIVTCVTEDDVKNNRMFAAGDAMKGCRYDRFAMANGRIDATMNCSHQGVKMAATMSGTYGKDAYAIEVTSKVSGADIPGAGISNTVAVTAKRTGECRGNEPREATPPPA